MKMVKIVVGVLVAAAFLAMAPVSCGSQAHCPPNKPTCGG